MDTDNRVYLSPIMDLYFGEIILSNISNHPTVDFVMKPLQEVINRISNLKYRTTIHSDQGIQYQSHAWNKELADNQIFQSMSRKENCLDNSPMESFFHIRKAKIMETIYDSRENLVAAMNLWIDYYNNHCIKTKLGGNYPDQYRKLSA